MVLDLRLGRRYCNKMTFCVERLFYCITARKLLMDSVMLNKNFSYLSEFVCFAWWKAFTCEIYCSSANEECLGFLSIHLHRCYMSDQSH